MGTGKGKMEYRLLRGAIRLMSCIPFNTGQFLGKMLGTAAYFLPIERRRVVHENIVTTIGKEMGYGDIRRLVKRVYRHYGQMLFEVPHIVRLSPKNINRYVVFENPDVLERAVALGKGVFLLTAHFGNWELLSAAVAIRFGGVLVVARSIDYSPADTVINELRCRFGTEIIYKQRAMRKILEGIKAGKMVGILLDQNVDWYEGVFVDFLGRPACTNKGLAAIALKTGSPVLPCFSIRQRDGRYRVVFEKEIELNGTGDRTRDVEEGTAKLTGVIERYVRLYPDHWFWFHRRWKTLPYCTLPGSTGIESQVPGRSHA
ncbi:MAG: lysophospholipid acyltransferase family protein [Deltaproteobacteria bacterium]|nr:lysophospholipid acyltransferase family protein [Deltaproteobacteria bacterium]